MIKNPLNVSYKDLVTSTEKRILWMEKSYPGQVMTNRIDSWTATHNIAVEKAKLKLFRKFQKDPQIDLFMEFEKTRK